MLQLYILNGPNRGDSYKLSQGTNYVGRSVDNDVRIGDRTVSRKHLSIFRDNAKCFITDLKSRNGTLYRGSLITPGASVEVEQGFPIALGMAAVCVGETCADEIMPFPELLGLATESKEEKTSGAQRRRRPNQKRIEFVLKLADVFRENFSIRKTQEKILQHILRFLKRIDRASFVLIDPNVSETGMITSRSKKERPYGFRRDDLLLFMDLTQRVAIALENIRLVSEIATIADALTIDH